METSDVRSIESLRRLRLATAALAHDWEGAVQQIRFGMHRIQDHFSATMPAYWKQQTRAAEQKVAEALDNLSRHQASSGQGRAPAITEAKQRVQMARRRLATCETKLRTAVNIAIHFERSCQELAGPLAEVAGHVNTTLPNAAGHLEMLIGHLERYTELSRSQSRPDTPFPPPSP